MAFTPLQQKAIEARGGNLLVSASAGSGKTTVMIARILKLLEEGESLDNMVICTFTRSAAADMRDKLQNRLMEAAEEGAAYADAQLQKLPTAEISTIHSWCQRLIKTYFHAIDVDPAFEIADDADARAMLNKAAEEAVEEMINAQPLDADFAEFYDIMQSRRSDAPLKRLIVSVYDFAAAQTDIDGWLNDNALSGYSRPELADAIVKSEMKNLTARFLPAAEDLLRRTTNAGFTRNIAAIESLIELIQGAPVEVKLPGGKFPEEFTGLNEELKNLKKAYLKAADEISEYGVLPDPDAPPAFTKVLVNLVKRAKELYEKEKAAKAKLDYGDLEHLTARLVSDPAILAEIKAKYKRVFVDEYQDVNPIQEYIISSVKDRDNMFLVGDVKQSIYAFRMCDPGIFLDKYLHPEKYGFDLPIELNANFRSAEKILDFCNEVFEPLMTDRFGQIDYRGSARLVGGRGLKGGEVGLNLVVCRKKEKAAGGVYSVLNHEEDESAVKVDAETNLIASDITEKLSDGFIPCGEGSRRIAPGDIAVLVSTRGKHVSMLYDKLKRAGVNVSVSDKLKFTSVHEVEVLIEFLKYLINRTDDIALVSVLRSALIGVTDDELADIRLSGAREEKRFYKLCEDYAIKHDDGLSAKLKAFYELTDRYTDYSYTMTAGELIGALTAEKQWFSYVLSSAGGDIKAEALDSFLSSACESPYGGSIGEYVEYLERGADEFERPPASGAVAIMTVHASKGLEFPLVYLAGTDKSFNLSDERGKVITDSELGVCMKNHDLCKRVVEQNKLTFAAGLKIRRKLLEEKMRLLYVALTRAQFGLYIYACASEKDELMSDGAGGFYDYEGGRSFFDWLKPVYAARGFNAVNEEDCTLKNVDGLSGRLIGGKPDERLVKVIGEYLKDDYKHAHGFIKSSVTAMNEDAADEKPHYAAGADDDRAAKRGNAYHKAMELIDFNADFAEEWERLKHIGDIGELVGEEKIRVAAEKIGRFVSGKKFYREKQFVYNMKGTLVQGVIDLIVTDGKDCAIVDYKTSKASTIKNGAYDLQLSVYARAAEDVLGVKVTKTLVYSFEISDFIETKRVPLPSFA